MPAFARPGGSGGRLAVALGVLGRSDPQPDGQHNTRLWALGCGLWAWGGGGDFQGRPTANSLKPLKSLRRRHLRSDRVDQEFQRRIQGLGAGSLPPAVAHAHDDELVRRNDKDVLSAGP